MTESLDLAEGAWYTKEDFLDLYLHSLPVDDGRPQVTRYRSMCIEQCCYMCC